MLRGKIYSYQPPLNPGVRIWFYDVYDTEARSGNRNVIAGQRLTQKGAMVATCLFLKHKSENRVK